MDSEKNSSPTVLDAGNRVIDEAKTVNHDIEENSVGEPQPEASNNLGPNIVDWDGPDDVERPLNWKPRKVIVTLSLVSVITFLR